VPILGFCELLQIRPEILADRTKALTYLETIQTAAKDAASVVSRLREFYRADKGHTPFTPVNLKRLVEQTITLTRPKWKEQAQAAGVTIAVALELEAVPPIAGEESALREVLTNLIFNAVDAMPGGGTLTFRTRREGDTGVIEVADTGTGMTEEVRQRCLEPFFSTKGEHGTGLGLAMVFGIVQRHSGSLDLYSTPGQGTTFSIKLPLMDASGSHAAEVKASRPTPAFRILVAEDDPRGGRPRSGTRRGRRRRPEALSERPFRRRDHGQGDARHERRPDGGRDQANSAGDADYPPHRVRALL
jgi:signal transduction histidine kinase